MNLHNLKVMALQKLMPNGGWSVTGTEVSFYAVQQVSESEIQEKIAELQTAEPMRLLRLERNLKLTETDWWCCSDRTPTQAQLDYRQALRDLPSTASPSLDENEQLTGVEWPNKPE